MDLDDRRTGQPACPGLGPVVRRCLDAVSPMFDGRRTDNRVLGRFGAILFACAGVIVAATAPMTSTQVAPLEVAAFLCLVAAATFAVLPWHRWPRVALTAQTGLALVLLATAARFSGAIDHYLPMFFAVFVFVGLTQRIRATAFVVPFAILAFLVAAPAPSSRTLSDFAVTLTLAVVVSMTLSLFVRGAEASRSRLRHLLLSSNTILRSTDLRSTVRTLEREANAVVAADEVMTLLVEPPDTSRLVAMGAGIPTPSRPTVSIDVRREPGTIGQVLATGRRSFVRTAGEPGLAGRFGAAFDGGSLLVLPIAGEEHPVGVLVFSWRSPRRPIDEVLAQSVELLCVEAGVVIERHHAVERATSESLTDPLTGLLNRRAIDAHLESIEPNDALVLLDIDHFKAINDTAGHARGDQILQTFADCITTTCRSDDLCARIGGDEMLLVLRGAGSGGARSVLHDLHQAWRVESHETTFSAGVALVRGGDDARQVLARADEALYSAKARGRNRTEVALGV